MRHRDQAKNTTWKDIVKAMKDDKWVYYRKHGDKLKFLRTP